MGPAGVGRGSNDASSYPFRARFVPGVCALAPIAVVVIAAGWEDAKVVASVLSLAGTMGLGLVLQAVVRQRGHRFDVVLLPESGGLWPTTRMMWPGGPDAARSATNRRVIEAVTGRRLPDREPATDVERSETVAALDDAVAEVRARTRDRSVFGMLAEENAEYGMWRNMLGMRTPGAVVAAAGVVAALGLALLAADDRISADGAMLVVGAVVSAVWLGLWISIPTRDRVVRAGDRYALALFDSARTLAASSGAGGDRSPT